MVDDARQTNAHFSEMTGELFRAGKHMNRSYRLLLFIPNLVTQLVLDCALHVVAIRLKAVASINAALDSFVLLSILLSL